MSMARRVLQNTLLNLVWSISQRLGQTVIFILIARLLTAEATGAFKLAISYASILLALSLWGLDQLLIREVARERSSAGRYLGAFLPLRLLLGVGLWLGLALIVPALPYTAASGKLILVIALSIIPDSISNLYQAVWIAYENVKPVALISLFFSAVRVAAGAAALWLTASLPLIAALLVLISVMEMLMMIIMTHRLGRISIRWGGGVKTWLEHLKLATPLIIVALLLRIEYQGDIVILSLFRSQDEVGIYGAASTVVTLLLFLPRSYQLAIFPALSRAYHTSPIRLQIVYGRSIQLLLLGSLIVAGAVSLLGGQIINLIFGPGYEEAGRVLAVLTWTPFFAALNVPNSRLLIVANKQRLIAYFAILSTASSLGLSLLLAPRFGGMGIAWARVLAMPLYTIPAYLYVQHYICPLNWHILWCRNVSKHST